MAKRPEYVWRCSELCRQFSSSMCDADSKVCDVNISHICHKIKKFGGDFEYIKTVEEFDYIFQYPRQPEPDFFAEKSN